MVDFYGKKCLSYIYFTFLIKFIKFSIICKSKLFLVQKIRLLAFILFLILNQSEKKLGKNHFFNFFIQFEIEKYEMNVKYLSTLWKTH